MRAGLANELQRDVAQANSQADLARRSLERDEQLFAEGLIAQSRLEAAPRDEGSRLFELIRIVQLVGIVEVVRGEEPAGLFAVDGRAWFLELARLLHTLDSAAAPDCHRCQ